MTGSCAGRCPAQDMLGWAMADRSEQRRGLPARLPAAHPPSQYRSRDRKSTRLNSKSPVHLVCRHLLEKKKKKTKQNPSKKTKDNNHYKNKTPKTHTTHSNTTKKHPQNHQYTTSSHTLPNSSTTKYHH